MYLKVNHRAAEVALERRNEERPYHHGNGCREEKKPKIGKHALLDVVSQVFFNALCEERALKGICRARDERDDAEKRERYGNPASANACDPNRVCQRGDHVDNKCENANYQQLSVHGSGSGRGRCSLHAIVSQAIAPVQRADNPPLRAHEPRLCSSIPSEYRRTCYSQHSISSAKLPHNEQRLTSDEQRMESRFSLEARECVPTRRLQKP